MSLLSPRDEFDRLSHRSTAEFTRRVARLLRARAASIPDQGEVERARASLGRLVLGTRLVAEALGRRRIMLEVDQMRGRRKLPSLAAAQYAADQNLLPRVDPEEAILDMIDREPRLAEDYKDVQELLSRERAFAVTRSTDLAVTEKIQSFHARALREGIGLPGAERTLQALGSWVRAYAETVFRTNLGTAYANGRWLEADDPDFAGFIVGLERLEVMDGETARRPGHWRAHGLTAAQRDPIWLKLGVPGGYNCRGVYRLVDVFEATRRGLMDGSIMRPATVPPGAFNDPGFDRRAGFDLFAA